MGSPTCSYLRSSTKSLLENLAHYIHNKFPDRPDRRLWVGDACPSSGNCSGHPGGSHSGGRKCDINYYTHDNTNCTQYGAMKGMKVVPVCDGNTVTKHFDWERNYYFIKKLYEMTNNRRSRTCDAIKEHITKQLKTNDEKNSWFKMLTSDPGSKYMHNMHYHLELEIL